MVSINVGKIASMLKDGAKVAFQEIKDNPAEGSVFDAAKKLGINNKEDLKAGFELFKEDPKGTAKCAIETLHEKGFFKSAGTEAGESSSQEFSVDNIGQNIKADATQAKMTKATDKTATQTKTTEVATTEEADKAEETTTATTAQDDKGASVVTEKDKEFGGILGKLGIKNTEDLKNGIKNLLDNPSDTAQSVAQKLGISEEQAKKVASFVSKYV